MVYYFLASLVIVFVLDIIGRAVLSLLKIDNISPFAIGLITFLAYSYITTSLLSALHCSFYIVLVIYALFFIFFLVYIIFNRKKINFKIDLLDYAIMIVFDIIMLIYAYNTTLGDPHGFDSTFYLNLVTSNIKSPALNTTINAHGNTYATIGSTYTYQTYYLVASVFTYIITPIINLFHQTYYPTVYVWVFQNIFNMFFCSLILSSFKSLKINKKYLLLISILFLFVFVYGRWYYINVYGFYGNTFRWITIGYTTLLLNELFQDANNKNKWLLLSLSLLSSASVSSSSLFINIFIMFSAFFILIKEEKNTVKRYCFVLLFLLTNLFSRFIDYNPIICLLISFVVCLVLFLLNDLIYKVFSNNKVQIITITIVTLAMFVLSFIATNNTIDFSAFFNNWSEVADMTVNYFNIFSISYFSYVKILFLSLLIINVVFNNKNKLVKALIIIFVCLLNPFCCSYINKIDVVWYRTFDYFFNPFTFVLMIKLLAEKINGKYVNIISAIILLITVNTNMIKPVYYHDSFVPGYNYDFDKLDNYNGEYKLIQDDVDVIDAIIKDSNYYGTSNPYIISPIIFTQAHIPNGRFMYFRDFYGRCPYKTESEKQLYSIFYPKRYEGEKLNDDILNYDQIYKYLLEAGIDYLVVDKKNEYYDSRIDKYSYLAYRVLEDMYPMYENDNYLVINCKKQ